MSIKLGELATRFGCELIGDPDIVIVEVASLINAGSGSLSFLSNPAFREHLASSQAAAVVLRAEDADRAPAAALISDNPYATYAKMAAFIVPTPAHVPGIHASAVVAATAAVADTAHIGANAVVAERTRIGANVFIGPGTVVGSDCVIGEDCRLHANVTIEHNVRMGARCVIHSGTVIGADGFGNAMTSDGWVKVPQLGGVQIGSDVEIGANSTVDRGALDDTIIEDGVRLDNLVMIAHNVKVGAHTAMAAMTGISGSTIIGKRCLFAGQSGAVGHIEICDDVVVSGQAMISKDIREPGVYASSFPAEKVGDWNRQVARFRRLHRLGERVALLEKRIEAISGDES